MLPNSHTIDIVPTVINRLGTALAPSEPGMPVATLKEVLKATSAPIVQLAMEPLAPPPTQHGPDVLAIYTRAYDWTISERHARMTIDHLLFALAERQIGASALLAGGVTAVGELEVELLNLVHKSPVDALVDGTHPAVDDAVLGVLNHALGYARPNGRATTNMSDLLDALLDALRNGEPDTPGMTALRRRWARATESDSVRQVLTRVLEVQASQPGMLAKALAAELTALRDRIDTLEKDALDATPPPSPSWYRRLNVLLALGLIALVSTGVGLWSFAT